DLFRPELLISLGVAVHPRGLRHGSAGDRTFSRHPGDEPVVKRSTARLLRALCWALLAMPLPGLAQDEAAAEALTVELAGEAIPEEAVLFAEAGSDEVAEAEAAGESGLDGLLRELATASLAESVRLLPQLEAEGGLAMLGLFEAMLTGELNYDAQTQRYWRLSEGADAVDVLSGATLPAAELQDTARIRLNNRLRTMLRQSIARINLTDGSARQRRGAALSMLSGIDADSVV